MKIIKDKNYLLKPTQSVASVQEGEEIAKKLLEMVNKLGCLGLTANQMGISKSVCCVKVKDREPIIMINPKFVSKSSEKLIYYEGCMSITGRKYQTVRHKTVTVACDNWANERTFAPDNFNEKDYGRDEGLLECVAVQHEICHTLGLLIDSPEIKFRIEPKVREVPKMGRNDKVVVQKDDKTERVKYKTALRMIDDGWKII